MRKLHINLTYTGYRPIAWISVLICGFYDVLSEYMGQNNIFPGPIYVTQFAYKY
jgi:phosphatidate phosphatase APP1